MKVLITGANGFVGGNVSRYLMAQGIECFALDVKGALEQGVYSERYTWDDLNTLDFSTFDAVIHLAGKAHDTKNTSDPQSYLDINVGLTKRILEKCGNAGIRECANLGETPRQGEAVPKQCAYSRIRALKFIFFSSVKACADTVEGVLTEECEPNPQTPYGKSKLEAEGVVRECANVGEKCGNAEILECANETPRQGEVDPSALAHSSIRALSCYILRPAMIHGPGNKGNLNLLVKTVQRGIPWPLGAFDNKRSFTSVENVSRVLEALLKEDVAPGIYQVADDQPLSTNQVIRLIAEALKKKPKIWRIPCGLMCGVARMGDLLHLPLNSERLKKLTESYVVSNAKLLRALGWQKMPVGAEEGIIVTTQWSQ